MSADESPVAEAHVIHPEIEPKTSCLSTTKPSLETLSPCSTTGTKEGYDPTSNDLYSSNPCSAFYSHPRTRTSFEQFKSESKVHFRLYELDLEAGSRITQAENLAQGQDRNKKDMAWPCSKQMELKRLALQKNQGCSPFRRFSKKQKFVIHALIALLIIGAITGLAVGISKAVGGGVFRSSNNSNAPIGSGG